MYRALTAELQIHQSPKKNVSSWDQGTEFFGFWKLSEFVNSQAKTHHCFSIVVFSGHVDYTSHGCMTVNLFGAYNIYNITFGNCNKDNSIDCHGLLPLSGNKNLKINKKHASRWKKTNCIYIYISSIYRQQFENFPVPRWTTWRLYPVYRSLYLPIFRSQFGCMGFSEKKKTVIPAPSLNHLRMIQDWLPSRSIGSPLKWTIFSVFWGITVLD